MAVQQFIKPQAPRQPLSVSRSASFEGAIPEGALVEVKSESQGPGVDWDPEQKVLRLPKSVVEASGERRTKLVIFTCNKCGGRTARNVNPVAWEKGLVMCQCAHCQAWHVLSAKNKKLFEEIRYKDEELTEASDADAAGNGQLMSKPQPPAAKGDDKD